MNNFQTYKNKQTGEEVLAEVVLITYFGWQFLTKEEKRNAASGHDNPHWDLIPDFVYKVKRDASYPRHIFEKQFEKVKNDKAK